MNSATKWIIGIIIVVAIIWFGYSKMNKTDVSDTTGVQEELPVDTSDTSATTGAADSVSVDASDTTTTQQ